jgi:membrane protease YdiL (CAAX protease family)
MSKKLSAGLGILYLLIVSAFLIGLGMSLPFTGFAKMAVYEGIIACVSILLIVLVRIAKRRPLLFLKPGEIAAPGKRMRIFLVKEGSSWRTTGLSLLVTVTVFLGIFMLMGMKQMNREFSLSAFFANIPFIIIFAVFNAWSEEIFYRLVPAEFFSRFNNEKIYPVISGLIFGAAHWWGSPGGPIGIVMAGLLGWILARSVLETKGIFWALIIHLAQDLVIFGILFGFGLL